MILALETSTNVCSAAFKDSAGEVYEKRTEERGSHSEKLFLFIEELMEEHKFGIGNLEALLISEGPGSYTGLRIGASAVKGLLFQSEVPLFGINTLASFAQAAADRNADVRTIHSIIDARRVHVYYQRFTCERKALGADSEVEVVPIERFEDLIGEGDAIAGTGLKRLSEETHGKTTVYDNDVISGRSLIRLYEEDSSRVFCRSVIPEEFNPRYYTSRQVSGK